ncbi:30S ribosomal protein S16 [Alphaproteobacteria bacterium]|nr:30S ribosomal protein S16 [Alphaproteobacteria bacterium]
MAVHLRMSRAGSKKRPFYNIVAANSRAPRDGRFIEALGTYNPMLARQAENRVVLNAERIKYWLSVGAQPSEKVAQFLGAAGLAPKPEHAERPHKSAPKAKAVERAKTKAAKASKAAE